MQIRNAEYSKWLHRATHYVNGDFSASGKQVHFVRFKSFPNLLSFADVLYANLKMQDF